MRMRRGGHGLRVCKKVLPNSQSWTSHLGLRFLGAEGKEKHVFCTCLASFTHLLPNSTSDYQPLFLLIPAP